MCVCAFRSIYDPMRPSSCVMVCPCKYVCVLICVSTRAHVCVWCRCPECGPKCSCDVLRTQQLCRGNVSLFIHVTHSNDTGKCMFVLVCFCLMKVVFYSISGMLFTFLAIHNIRMIVIYAVRILSCAVGLCKV